MNNSRPTKNGNVCIIYLFVSTFLAIIGDIQRTRSTHVRVNPIHATRPSTDAEGRDEVTKTLTAARRLAE